MSEQAQYLEGLARLSKESSAEGRQQLLHEVTSLFMDEPASLNEQEIAYFGDIIGKLAQQVEARVRQHLSETIACEVNAPPQLIRDLANDKIEVARPILQQSVVLKDSDLLQLIGRHGQEHMLAISMRSEVSEKVSGALVERGNDRVLGSLASNNGAELSGKSLETMLSRAGDMDSLKDVLIARNDISPDLVETLFRQVSHTLRDQILATESGWGEQKVDQILSETHKWFKSETRSSARSAVDGYIARKDKLGQLDTTFLVDVLRRGELEKFVAGIARLTRIDSTTAHKTVFDKSGEKLAIICRSIDISPDVFSEFLDLTNFDKSRMEADKMALMGVYGRITPESAQRALRFLRTRASVKKRMGEAD